MKKIIKYYLFTFLLLSVFSNTSTAQQSHLDYLGAGNDEGITITSSDNENSQIGENSLNGTGHLQDPALMARFLLQAGFGESYNNIMLESELSYDEWLEQQFNVDPESFVEMLEDLEDYWYSFPAVDYFAPLDDNFFEMWWHKMMTGEDVLRQRVAYGLSQTIVVSSKRGLLGELGLGVGTFYDILYLNAFGNYHDILMEISLNPAMAHYLTFLNNPKEDTIDNIHPDENYARELMQLFTIGLYELNLDGSRKMTANGDFIPTYDNADIKEFAKIFTGLGSETIEVDGNIYGGFGTTIEYFDASQPLIIYEEWHDQGPKTLLNNFNIPAGQGGMADIEDAIDHLFNHPNVGPFVGHQLIQRLVKSNPSPQYIERVAAVFNDNGQGVRGDLQAVIRTILLDPEARDCEWTEVETAGRLTEPMLRFPHLLKATEGSNETGRYYYSGWDLFREIKHHVMLAPSVFNFYPPDYTPQGEISEAQLVAPEFKLMDTQLTMSYSNLVKYWLREEMIGSHDPAFIFMEEYEGLPMPVQDYILVNADTSGLELIFHTTFNQAIYYLVFFSDGQEVLFLWEDGTLVDWDSSFGDPEMFWDDFTPAIQNYLQQENLQDSISYAFSIFHLNKFEAVTVGLLDAGNFREISFNLDGSLFERDFINPGNVHTNLETEMEWLVTDHQALVDRLDLVYTQGTMSDFLREYLLEIIPQLGDEHTRKQKVHFLIELVMISPDYVIKR